MNKTHVLTLSKKDFEMQTFRAGGNGGQNQNKRDSGVRFIHRASGAVGESRQYRTQLENKKAAFRRMAEHPKMNIWLRIQAGLTVVSESEVDAMMQDENLKVEVKKDGRWVELT